MPLGVADSDRKDASAKRRAENRRRGGERSHRRVRARPLEPNRRYMITRRTLERRMFLHPDPVDGEEIVGFIGYTLGLSLANSGQRLHASLMMSNHHHTCVTDTNATLPGFKNQFHAFLARGVNAKRGRFDGFWTTHDPGDTEQLTDDETLEDIVYTYTNAVAAGLVKWAKDWPGFSTYGWKFGETRRYWRPKWFYDPENEDIPEYVDVELVRPDIFPELTDDELYDLIQRKVRERELALQRETAANGRRFKGLSKLRKQRWNQPARSPEERFHLTPQVSSTCAETRIARLQYKKDWKRKYAEAREELLAGHDAVFPYGTYWMRRFAGVRVAAAP